MAPESMDFLELMIRKERNHLARFKTRVREVEAKMLENDAMLSSAKEDKVGEASLRVSWQTRSWQGS